MSDLISRDLAIKAMMALEAEDIADYGCSIPEGFDGKRASDALSKIPSARPEPQWIPLSERWPEDDGLYLVSYKGVTKGALFAWGSWTMATEDGIGQALPDAWMPFPEPYGPEQ